MQLFLYEKRNDLMNVIDFFYKLIYFFLIVYNVFECSIKIWCQRPSHLLLFYYFMQNIFHIAAFKCFFIKNRNHLKWHFSNKNYVLMYIKKKTPKTWVPLWRNLDVWYSLCEETWRFRGEPLDDRICIFCDLNEIKTAEHFLFKYSSHNDLRNSLLDTTLGSVNDLFTGKTLLCNFPQQCAQFIFKAYRIKQTKLSRWLLNMY